MPRRLMIVGPGEVAWQTYEHQPLKPDQVRIRVVNAAEKHGTMMAFFKGYANQRGSWDGAMQLHRPGGMLWKYPLPAGNMVIGPVTEVGPSVTRHKVGDVVFFHGGFAETATASETAAVRLPQGVSWTSATCLDPAEFALGAIRDGHVRLGDHVAVFGLGAIGLMTVRLARLAGVSRLFAVDPIAGRRELATAFGADVALDPTVGDVGLILKEQTGGRGVDVAIEFSGAAPALQAAIRGAGYLGKVVCGAFPPPYPAGLDFGGEAHMNRPTLVFSRACSDPNPDHPRWDDARIVETCWQHIAAGRIVGDAIVEPVIPFDALPSEYPRIATEPQKHLKLGVQL